MLVRLFVRLFTILLSIAAMMMLVTEDRTFNLLPVVRRQNPDSLEPNIGVVIDFISKSYGEMIKISNKILDCNNAPEVKEVLCFAVLLQLKA